MILPREELPGGAHSMQAEPRKRHARYSNEWSDSPLRHRFVRYLVNERNLSVCTAWTYQCGLTRLEVFCGKPAEELTVTDVRAFLSETSFQPSTKNSVLAAIKSFHRWGVLEGEWELNALGLLVGPKMIRNPKPALTPEEARGVLALCRRPNETRLCYLGLFGGLRVTETASIGPDEWLKDRLRFVGKGRKEHEVPIHPELAARKDIILSRHPTRETLKQTCRAVSYALEVPFTSHALRRTFAQTLVEEGCNRDVVGALLGHTGNVTVTHYAPITFREKAEAIERLTY
jgi:site-specific recombinase XerD